MAKMGRPKSDVIKDKNCDNPNVCGGTSET